MLSRSKVSIFVLAVPGPGFVLDSLRTQLMLAIGREHIFIYSVDIMTIAA